MFKGRAVGLIPICTGVVDVETLRILLFAEGRGRNEKTDVVSSCFSATLCGDHEAAKRPYKKSPTRT